VGRAHFAAGQFVFRKDEPGDVFYVIERGRAGVYLDEKASPVAFLDAGDHFGEGAVLTPGGKGRHTASIRAETSLDLITLGSDDCRRLTGSLDALQKAVRRSLAARRGYGRFIDIVREEPRLRDHRVADLMSSPPETLTPEMTLEQTVSRFHGGRPGYPVADSDGALIGYCGRTELYEALRAVLAPETPLREFMRSDPPQIAEDQALSEATVLMLREQVEVLPIVAADGSGRVAGVLSPLDVFRHAVALRTARKSRGAGG
jgi:signal-transduction protein with cAMP-binding, CBS, and nucleotidyltransferase domain